MSEAERVNRAVTYVLLELRVVEVGSPPSAVVDVVIAEAKSVVELWLFMHLSD